MGSAAILFRPPAEKDSDNDIRRRIHSQAGVVCTLLVSRVILAVIFTIVKLGGINSVVPGTVPGVVAAKYNFKSLAS